MAARREQEILCYVVLRCHPLIAACVSPLPRRSTQLDARMNTRRGQQPPQAWLCSLRLSLPRNSSNEFALWRLADSTATPPREQHGTDKATPGRRGRAQQREAEWSVRTARPDVPIKGDGTVRPCYSVFVVARPPKADGSGPPTELSGSSDLVTRYDDGTRLRVPSVPKTSPPLARLVALPDADAVDESLRQSLRCYVSSVAAFVRSQQRLPLTTTPQPVERTARPRQSPE